MPLLFVKDGSNNFSACIRKTDKWKARNFQALKISSTAWTWLGSPKLCFNVAAYYTYILFAPFLPSNKETETARIKKRGKDIHNAIHTKVL